MLAHSAIRSIELSSEPLRTILKYTDFFHSRFNVMPPKRPVTLSPTVPHSHSPISVALGGRMAKTKDDLR